MATDEAPIRIGEVLNGGRGEGSEATQDSPPSPTMENPAHQHRLQEFDVQTQQSPLAARTRKYRRSTNTKQGDPRGIPEISATLQLLCEQYTRTIRRLHDVAEAINNCRDQLEEARDVITTISDYFEYDYRAREACNATIDHYRDHTRPRRSTNEPY